jgi:hypothetical protein
MSLACSGNLSMGGKGDAAMKKIAAILALAFALTIGMTLTTAFVLNLLPLHLT